MVERFLRASGDEAPAGGRRQDLAVDGGRDPLDGERAGTAGKE